MPWTNITNEGNPYKSGESGTCWRNDLPIFAHELIAAHNERTRAIGGTVRPWSLGYCYTAEHVRVGERFIVISHAQSLQTVMPFDILVGEEVMVVTKLFLYSGTSHMHVIRTKEIEHESGSICIIRREEPTVEELGACGNAAMYGILQNLRRTPGGTGGGVVPSNPALVWVNNDYSRPLEFNYHPSGGILIFQDAKTLAQKFKGSSYNKNPAFTIEVIGGAGLDRFSFVLPGLGFFFGGGAALFPLTVTVAQIAEALLKSVYIEPGDFTVEKKDGKFIITFGGGLEHIPIDPYVVVFRDGINGDPNFNVVLEVTQPGGWLSVSRIMDPDPWHQIREVLYNFKHAWAGIGVTSSLCRYGVSSGYGEYAWDAARVAIEELEPGGNWCGYIIIPRVSGYSGYDGSVAIASYAEITSIIYVDPGGEVVGGLVTVEVSEANGSGPYHTLPQMRPEEFQTVPPNWMSVSWGVPVDSSDLSTEGQSVLVSLGGDEYEKFAKFVYWNSYDRFGYNWPASGVRASLKIDIQAWHKNHALNGTYNYPAPKEEVA